MHVDPIVLRLTAGPRSGETVTVDRELTLGRESGDVVIEDEELSRRHLRVRPTPSGLEVEDLGSTNGTLANGEPVTGPRVVGDGTVLTFGATKATVAVGAGADAGRTELRPRAQAGPSASEGPPAPGAPAGAPPAGQPAAPLEPIPSNVARVATPLVARPQRSRGTRILYAAALLLLGGAIGAAITLAARSSGSSTSAGDASSLVEGTFAADEPGCVNDDNGRSGPGHFRFITSTCENAGRTIATLPLHRGVSGGENVDYVVTDDSNRADAAKRGVNFVPKLANAIGSPAVQKVTLTGGVVQFPATVNFAHTRVLVPGPSGFPPQSASPPAVANPGYSPLIELPDGTVLNAPQVVNSTGKGPKVVSVDLGKMTVRYRETEGRYENKHVHYMSFESGNPIAASLENVTYAPLLNQVPKQGDEGLHGSSREELIAFVNGPINTHTFPQNPERQGENSVAFGQGDPRNILHETPVLPDHANVGDEAYAPMWDVHFAEWTANAVAAGDRTGIRSVPDVEARLPRGTAACEQDTKACREGLITAPEGKAFGPSGFVVNCPLLSIDLP